MSADIVIKNRHRKFPVNIRFLRRLALEVLAEFGEEFDLCVYLVATSEMTRMNNEFLGHAGSTDVITFDYAANSGSGHCAARSSNTPALHGEIFICLDEAALQARHFRTTWQSEVVRYLVHGLLHMRGFSDARLADHRRMKRKENQLMAGLESRHALAKLAVRRSPRFPRSTLSKNKRRPRLAA